MMQKRENEYFRKLALRNATRKRLGAEYNGNAMLLYHKDEITEEDAEKITALFKQGIAYGNSDAMLNMALMLFVYTPSDLVGALHYITQACQTGNEGEGRDNILQCPLVRGGVERNLAKIYSAITNMLSVADSFSFCPSDFTKIRAPEEQKVALVFLKVLSENEKKNSLKQQIIDAFQIASEWPVFRKWHREVSDCRLNQRKLALTLPKYSLLFYQLDKVLLIEESGQKNNYKQ